MNLGSTGSTRAGSMTPGGNNRVRRYTARISTPKEFGAHWRARAKSASLNGELPRKSEPIEFWLITVHAGVAETAPQRSYLRCESSDLNDERLQVNSMSGAEGGIRTHTGLLPTDFKSQIACYRTYASVPISTSLLAFPLTL